MRKSTMPSDEQAGNGAGDVCAVMGCEGGDLFRLDIMGQPTTAYLCGDHVGFVRQFSLTMPNDERPVLVGDYDTMIIARMFEGPLLSECSNFDYETEQIEEVEIRVDDTRLQAELRLLAAAHKRIVHPLSDDCQCIRRLP